MKNIKKIAVWTALVSILSCGNNIVLASNEQLNILKTDISSDSLKSDDYFLSFEDFKIFLEHRNELVDTNHLSKDSVDVDELVSIIKNNSSKFENKDQFTEYIPFFEYSDNAVHDEKLKEALHILIENNLVTENDYKRLSELQIIAPLEFMASFGAYDPNYNILVVPVGTINEYTINNPKVDYNDFLLSIFIHELFHVTQASTNEKFGTTSFPFEFILEGSATSFSINELDESVVPYKEELNAEELIKMLIMTNGNTITDYYNAVGNNDLNLLLELCGAKTLEQKHQMYNLISSFDMVIDTSNRLAVLRGFNNIDINSNIDIYNLDREQREEIIGTSHIVDIYKMICDNLINNKDMEMLEIASLIEYSTQIATKYMPSEKKSDIEKIKFDTRYRLRKKFGLSVSSYEVAIIYGRYETEKMNNKINTGFLSKYALYPNHQEEELENINIRQKI